MLRDLCARREATSVVVRCYTPTFDSIFISRSALRR
jgi:hypothetical protein